MEMNKGAVGIFLALCVVGGATGFYLATSGQPQPAFEAASPAVVSDSAPQPIDTPAARPASAPAAASPAVVAERRVAPAPRTAPPAPRSVASAAASPRPTPAITREGSIAPPPPERPRTVTAVETPAATPAAAEPARSFEPEPEETIVAAQPQFVELVVPAESVIGLQVESALSSERAQVEDEVVARVSRDVRVDDRVAIPSGAKAHGQVTLVERGGRLRQRARLGIRFTSIVLADGTRIPLETETIYREGDSPGGESAAKIGGGAIGGAIIGGILGGAKGAVIGGSVGAGAGTAAVYTGGPNAATFPNGTPITVRLVEPATVTVEPGH
jgi:hypothetical protein